MAGRPTALTAEVFDSIITALRAGNYLTVAAQHAGVSPDTVSAWVRRGTEGTPDFEERGPFSDEQLRTLGACPNCKGSGREPGVRPHTTRRCHLRCDAGMRRGFDRSTLDVDDALFVRFGREVARARADAEVHAVAILRQSMLAGDWKAAVEYLKRAHPERWREEVAHETTISAQHSGVVTIVSDEDRALALVKAMEDADLALPLADVPASNGSGNGASSNGHR